MESPLKLSWKEFNALPKIQRDSDFHCVTRWSRFDNHWDGVAFRELLARVRTNAERKPMFWCMPNRDTPPMFPWPISIAKRCYSQLTMTASR